MHRVPRTSSASLTFDEELGGALLLSDHAAIRGVVCQGAVVDGDVAHVADALKDVPWRDGQSVSDNVQNMLPKWFGLFWQTDLLEFRRRDPVCCRQSENEDRQKQTPQYLQHL